MMQHSDRDVLYAILRQDFEAFVRKVFHTLCPGQTFVAAWFIAAIAYQLERVRLGEIRRLIINMPPRSLKSIMASVAFPAFVLGHDPTQRIVCASYSGELAFKLSNDFRAILASDWYRTIFPATRIGPYKNSETEVELTRRGFRLASSTGATITGRGGQIIVIDDPLKPVDALSDAKRSAVNAWFNNTVISRPDDKRTGAIVIVMQRIHLEDLTGFVLGQSDEWTVLSLPAIAETVESIPLSMDRVHQRQLGEVLSPEREPTEVLEQLRLQMGSDLFSAQYQQAPVPPGGAMIKRAWIRRYDSLPPTSSSQFVVQSWDTAAKGGPDNDWSVCTTWCVTNDCQFYLLDVWRGRVDYPTLKVKVRELAKQWSAHQVLIEESGTAIGLLDELRHQVRGLTPIKPDKDKQTRMSIASASFEAGQIYFPQRASWLPELEAELFTFPGSRHDDQVDSISQAINYTKSSNVWIWRRFARANIQMLQPTSVPRYWDPYRPLWR
jgi:predicted phage terminase large subunit-like protein